MVELRKRTATPVSTSSDDEFMESNKKVAIEASNSRLRYSSPSNAQQETEDIEIYGEDNQNVQNQGLPCRLLSDFVVYDLMKGNALVSLDKIGENNRDVRAAGKVKPLLAETPDDEEEVEEEEEEEGFNDNSLEQFLELSCIFYWEVQLQTSGKSSIWVRTQFAYYKLEDPDLAYLNLLKPVFIRTRLSNRIIVHMLNHSEDSLSSFMNLLGKEDSLDPTITSSERKLELEFSKKNVESNVDFICEEVAAWIEESNAFEIVAHPLLQDLYNLRQKGIPITAKKVRKAETLSNDTEFRRTQRNVDKFVLEKRNPPCVTPLIFNLGKIFFDKHMSTPSEEGPVDSIDLTEQVPLPIVAKEGKNLQSFYPPNRSGNEVHFIGEPTAEQGVFKYYSKVSVDGDIIAPGDFIFCLRQQDRGKQLPHIMRLEYIFHNTATSQSYFHASYFIPATQTVLEETANPFEICTVDDCTTNKLDRIIGKCSCSFVKNDENEPTKSLFYRYWYNEQNAVFEDVMSHSHSTFIFCKPNQPCQSCESNMRNTSLQVKEMGKLFKYKNHEYQLYGFAYLRPNVKDAPYDIGQILKMDIRKSSKEIYLEAAPCSIFVTLRIFKRTPTVTQKGFQAKDNRCLQSTRRTVMVPHTQLEGTCIVLPLSKIKDLDAFKNESDHFYVIEKNYEKSPELLKEVTLFQESPAEIKRQEFYQTFRKEIKPLVALDIFAGCGGLTCGMHKTGLIDTKYAIEFSSSAALSFRNNFPGATVFNQCANILLDRAISLYQRNITPSPMKDFLGEPLADLPPPGAVDFIYCGPPCQGFSGINRFKQANDIKNTLIATSLSYVDFYKPKYFLLENVRGMLTFRLGGQQAGTNKIQGGIKMGVVKFIVRSLTTMGYQVKFGILQAGNLGCAQSRRRLIFWGAQRGLTLPKYPQPIYCFPKNASMTINLPSGKSFSVSERQQGCAPLPTITVGDSISDLPGFEFSNPCKVYPEDEEERQYVSASKYDQYEVPSKGYVGLMEQPITTPPLSEFQRQVREGLKETIVGQVTRIFNDVTVERICRVPMIPGADHSALPEKLKPWCLSHKDSAASKHNGWKGLFGRLDNQGHFSTCLTDIQPMGKQGTVLHPTQRRVLSVRECARIQGFPDTFVFLSVNSDVKDMHRQIGNAVPVPMAFELGKELVEALFQNFLREKGIVLESPTISLDALTSFSEEQAHDDGEDVDKKESFKESNEPGKSLKPVGYEVYVEIPSKRPSVEE